MRRYWKLGMAAFCAVGCGLILWQAVVEDSVLGLGLSAVWAICGFFWLGMWTREQR